MTAGDDEAAVASRHGGGNCLGGGACQLLHHESTLLCIADIGGRASCTGRLSPVSRRDTGDHNRNMRSMLVLGQSERRVAVVALAHVDAQHEGPILELGLEQAGDSVGWGGR